MALTFTLPSNPQHSTSDQIATVMADPGFGKHFTDHMTRIEWTPESGWHAAEVVPYGPITLDPAAAVLHYAQEIFEGMKAYRHADGSIHTFRPDQNAARYARSAARLGLPELAVDDFIGGIEALVGIDQIWVPSEGEQSLYLRPFMFASEAFLGVRPAHRVTHLVIASPVGPYFSGGVKPVDIWLELDYSRAAPGGTGAAKCGGNYAASLLAQAQAAEKGCSQVLFLDAIEHRWIEELGGMNLFVVTDNNELLTPELTGTILEGVTRHSILQVAADLGLTPVERRISYEELSKGIREGHFTELFACGTAAVITPIGSIKSAREDLVLDPTDDPISLKIRQQLVDIQYGRADDTHGWLHRLA